MRVTNLTGAIVLIKIQHKVDVVPSNIKGFKWHIPEMDDDGGVHIETDEDLIKLSNEICDFDKLIDEVIEQIKHDINVSEDFTAIDELLRTVPRDSSRTMSESIRVDGVKPIDLENNIVKLLSDVPFRKYYMETETSDELTKEELEVIERIIN